MSMVAVVEAHAEQRRSLIERIMRLLLGLWGSPGTLDDPVRVHAATAATILYVDQALEAARLQERAYVQSYARELGVEYSPDELATEPVYPRNADLVDVYERFVEEYRWQRFGRVNAERSEDVPDSHGLGLDDGGAGDESAVAVDPVSRRVPQRGGPSVDDLAAIFEVDEEPRREFDPGQWDELERLNRQQEEWELEQAEEAFQAALARLEKNVTDDVNLVAGDEHRQLLEKKSLWLGYRRVIHPELSESGTCGLCMVASTRIYSKKWLLPMHPDCKCTVMGVSVDADPARDMNLADAVTLFDAGLNAEHGFSYEDLEEAYRLAGRVDGVGGTTGGELKEVRYEVIEHGELGPRLTEGRMRQDKPFVERTLADTRAMWSRTIEWAQVRRAEAVEARDAAAGNDPFAAEARSVYSQSVIHYDALISRLNGKLNKRLT